MKIYEKKANQKREKNERYPLYFESSKFRILISVTGRD